MVKLYKKSVDCFVCGKKIILEKDKFVLLSTYVKGSPIEEQRFHFDCFRKWHDQKTKEKAVNNLKRVMKPMGGLIANLKNQVGDFGNMEHFIKNEVPTIYFGEEKKEKKKKKCKKK